MAPALHAASRSAAAAGIARRPRRRTVGSPQSQIFLAAGNGRVWGFDISDHTLTRLYP